MMLEALVGALKAKDIPLTRGVATATLCTFRIGGRAALLIEPRSPQELVDSVRACKACGVRYVLLGRGSNILFDDGELSLALIRTTKINRVQMLHDGMCAQCGASLMRLSYLAAKQGLAELSFLCGIPGTLGGGILMNAGAYGYALSDVLETVSVYDPDGDFEKTLINGELNTSYRYSRFQDENSVILHARLRLRPGGCPEAILREMREKNARRAQTQPLQFPSAGSVFKRICAEQPLSEMMDKMGLKGMRVGDAAVSKRHAGFIVNLGNAKAADVRRLISNIQDLIEKERGIRPETEIRFIPSEV